VKYHRLKVVFGVVFISLEKGSASPGFSQIQATKKLAEDHFHCQLFEKFALLRLTRIF
jgi:hypothetical protein